MYSLLNLKRSILSALVLTGSVAAGLCASAISRSGSEYRFLPALPGDQLLAQMSFNSKGGYLLVQDNSIDGSGLGIRYRRYAPDFSAYPSTYQVDSFIGGDQQNAVVAALPEGGAAFAWESSTASGHRVFIRFLDEGGIFRSRESLASDSVVGSQSFPAIAALNDGSVVVVWTEYKREPTSAESEINTPVMQGVFAQRFTSAGARLGGTFQINQISAFDQRSPVIAALPNGGFVVGWISDQVRYSESVDFNGRIYTAQGEPTGSEFRLNSSEKICANPSIVALPNGFRAAWSGLGHMLSETSGWAESGARNINGWDPITRVFDQQGRGLGDEVIVNNTTKGDQFSPKIASLGDRQLLVWTSFGQDGADEGIYGRLIDSENHFLGNEFLVNTRTITKQIFPAVAAVGPQSFTVIWSSFTGGIASYDLFAQNYTSAATSDLPAPSAPVASSLSQNSVSLTWGEQFAQQVGGYLVYVDEETGAEQTSESMITITRASWQPGSTHTFRLAYKTLDGKFSAASEPVSIVTWGADSNGDGLPDDWQRENWGKNWPGANDDTDLDGASNMDEFLAGTDPTDAASVLRLRISTRELGMYLEWNTLPGNFYQVQVTSDFKTWRNVSTPRFAPSTTDSLPAAEPGQVRYYRVIRMR